MAGDLIPPPSPAGRPAPDAAAPAQIPKRAAVEEKPSAAATEPPPFRGRFGFVWGALAGVAVCVAAVTVALATAPGDAAPALAKNWSSWHPSTTRMQAGAEQIAAHVALRYKDPSGEQLAAIRATNMEIGGEPLGVAVRPKGGELQVLKGDGLIFLLTLLDTGKVSAKERKARERLLRREAVELALYSFRYLDDVTMVTVALPRSDNGDSAQSRAIFYRPGDLLPELQVPLQRTLRTRGEVDSLALRNFFHFSIQPLDSDRSYLVLVEPDVLPAS